MKTIYFAGPLFSAAEKKFNIELSNVLISKGFNIFLPQKECKKKEGVDIFTTCKNGIESSSVILAILDGADADSGTCWECGYAYALDKTVIIVRTDFRNSGDTKGFNAMLYYSATHIVEDAEDYTEKVLGILESLKKESLY